MFLIIHVLHNDELRDNNLEQNIVIKQVHMKRVIKWFQTKDENKNNQEIEWRISIIESVISTTVHELIATLQLKLPQTRATNSSLPQPIAFIAYIPF